MNKEIGDRIKAIRISKKLYPKDVGAEIGMLQTSYSKIERGGNTSVETILKIAKVLGVSAAEFFGDVQMVAEPVEKIGFVTREEWVQGNREIINAVKEEIAQLREELSLKKEGYKQKAKKVSRKNK